jgi:hypothetical protein
LELLPRFGGRLCVTVELRTRGTRSCRHHALVWLGSIRGLLTKALSGLALGGGLRGDELQSLSVPMPKGECARFLDLGFARCGLGGP